MRESESESEVDYISNLLLSLIWYIYGFLTRRTKAHLVMTTVNDKLCRF